MSKYIKPSSKKAGLAPGSYVFIGDQKVEDIRISITDYDEQNHKFISVKDLEEIFPFRDRPTISWINIYGLHETSILERIGNHFKIHPLVLEDIVNTDSRPKLEVNNNYVFIVLKMIYFDEEKSDLMIEQFSLIIGRNLVICFQERESNIFQSIRDRIQDSQSRLRKHSADYLAYILIDVIVDHYFVVLEKLGDNLELLEEEVLDTPGKDTLRKINHFKRNLILLRKHIWPLREVLGGLARGEIEHFEKTTLPYIRDCYDHIIRVIETIESYREMATGVLEIYLTNASNRLNEVMKVLTIIATIFIPLTFLTGLYGMNFEFMPELKWRSAYPVLLLIMILITAGMVVFFRKKDWL